jgi:hypothetical protein
MKLLGRCLLALVLQEGEELLREAYGPSAPLQPILFHKESDGAQQTLTPVPFV